MIDHAVNDRYRLHEWLDQILRSGRVVILSFASGEFDGECGTGAQRRTVQAPTLVGCIEGLTDHPRMKVCGRPGCLSGGKPWPLWRFGPDRDSADGRAAVCRDCESKRVSEHKRKKRRGA